MSRIPLAFLSFDAVHDEHSRAAFVLQAGESNALDVDHWSTQPGSPRDDWSDLVRTNISRCDLMIVVVGATSADSDGIRDEIRFAKRGNVPFFGVYAEGCGPGTRLPEGLPANRILAWDWQKVGAAVTQLMREGKNHAHA